MRSKNSYDPLKDFAPITQATKQDMLLVVHPSLPARTLKELLAYARSNPGKLNYGSGGYGVLSFVTAMTAAVAATASGTVDIPTASAPRRRSISVSAGVS